MRVKIVQTVTATNLAELRAARDGARGADLVELRLDGVRDIDVRGALEGRTTPVMVTCRPLWEGGRFDGAEEERLRILCDAAAAGAEFVDIEWKALVGLGATMDVLLHGKRGSSARPGGARLVLSHHDFTGVPDDAAARLEAMRREAPTAVIKFAAATSSLGDVLRLAAAAAASPAVDAATGLDGARVVIGMGAAGTITRVCPWLFGSCWTYAGAAAPGQLSLDELDQRYRVRTGSPGRRLFAITGAPLAHSASPAMHNAAFAALGIDASYVPLESRDPAEFLRAAERFGVEGASVTAPMKLGWARVGVELDDAARELGAVNTLKRAGGAWMGRNFDMVGFLDPLDARGLDLAGRRALVLGTGGAARAAVRALQSRGARVVIAGRRPQAARDLAAALQVDAAPWPMSTSDGRDSEDSRGGNPRSARSGPDSGDHAGDRDYDVLVNATPVGTRPADDEMPVSRDSLTKMLVGARLVYDLVYNPRDTALLRAARAAGAETIGGLDMLVGQACRQFEWWTGRPAPADVMARAAAAFLDSAESL